VDSLRTARILLLVNYRPEYHHQWGNRTHYTQLRLDPLGKGSAEEILTSVIGDEAELAPLTRLIIERSQGNPFFMEEIVQALLDDGTLARNGHCRLTRPLPELKIPPTVRATLAARIDRLAAAEKELLQALAVIGKEIAPELVKAVTGTADEQLETMLIALEMSEFIYEQPSSRDAEYVFKHALTQEVAYNSVLGERRRLIHTQTAQAIEALYAGQLDDHLSELARHHLRGNDAKKAVQYGELAAEQAISRAAYTEAARMIQAALKLLDQLPNEAERVRAELPIRNLEIVLAFTLYGGASSERERAIGRACVLGEKIGGREEVASLLTLSNLYFQRGEAMQRVELPERCLN
jgi:predicted ATPase